MTLARGCQILRRWPDADEAVKGTGRLVAANRLAVQEIGGRHEAVDVRDGGSIGQYQFNPGAIVELDVPQELRRPTVVLRRIPCRALLAVDENDALIARIDGHPDVPSSAQIPGARGGHRQRDQAKSSEQDLSHGAQRIMADPEASNAV